MIRCENCGQVGKGSSATADETLLGEDGFTYCCGAAWTTVQDTAAMLAADDRYNDMVRAILATERQRERDSDLHRGTFEYPEDWGA